MTSQHQSLLRSKDLSLLKLHSTFNISRTTTLATSELHSLPNQYSQPHWVLNKVGIFSWCCANVFMSFSSVSPKCRNDCIREWDVDTLVI
ncbi:hypothetical protein CEXT_806191 [Caerostris extrusa]|uniref:Uncharacterized protein n=1 Tax=Caerostris extrusa TaxID=172846 RepID=A0AAV4RC89_CAEEX|nr:hypothetical protein CEXT_806191 [Caerostris extrusa]